MTASVFMATAAGLPAFFGNRSHTMFNGTYSNPVPFTFHKLATTMFAEGLAESLGNSATIQRITKLMRAAK